MQEILEGEILAQEIRKLDLWILSEDKNAISRNFNFKNFSECWAFMNRVALAAEKADHHPDWSNSYNTVAISLSTHSAGGITQKDIALALKINNFL